MFVKKRKSYHRKSVFCNICVLNCTALSQHNNTIEWEKKVVPANIPDLVEEGYCFMSQCWDGSTEFCNMNKTNL